MSDLLSEVQDEICLLTMNRISKHNAFDRALLSALQEAIEAALSHSKVRVILLKAHGKHFSAGADLDWMHSMAEWDEEENQRDALVLGNLMYSIYQSPKPTLAMVQGSAFGGGAGLVAACDIGIAAASARFCFSEVRLGLVPAVISPYVVKAMGERSAKALFMSAEIFNAERAMDLHLIQHCVPDTELLAFSLQYANQIAQQAPKAVQISKQLAKKVANKEINEELVLYTASLIAQRRVSEEAKRGIKAFLKKENPPWNR